MKSLLFSSLAALGGFVVGIGVPWPGGKSELPEESPPPRRVAAERAWTAARLSPGERMAGIAEKAATLSSEEWPAFFRLQLGSPEASRLVARLWAESDPAGFWRWLKEGRDALLLGRFAGDLVRIWAAADPDAAMAGVLEITDRRTGDLLRRAAVDTVLERDLAKGLELAARAGDFNRFSWGVREWMKDDPGAAVRGLAGLPAASDYRRFLNTALPIWAEKDPQGALEWLKTVRPLHGEDWMAEGFKAVAKADPQEALAAARSVADPDARELALGGVVAGGAALATDELLDVLGELTPRARGWAVQELVSHPLATVEDLRKAAEALQDAPATRSLLTTTESLARKWARQDWQGGWEWAASLPDPARSRSALAVLASQAGPDQVQALAGAVADLPVSALSDDLFRNLLNRLPAGERGAWIRKLPADRAAWAESGGARVRE